MNDLHQMMPHSQIFQNYVVWPPQPPPPYPPENAVAFTPTPAFNPYLGRVKRNKKVNFHQTGSDLLHLFKSGTPNPKESHTPPANRSDEKGRWFHHPRRKFGVGGCSNRLTPPLAPRNTTSFIIRTRKSGGIVSPAIFSAASPETLATESIIPETFDEEAVKKKWGFNGYGSMKGLIRLRAGKYGSGELSGAGRFEMVCMNSGEEQNLDKRVDEQDSHIAHLEEENLTLKERMLLMERQLGELRKRVLSLETDGTLIDGGEGQGETENFLDGKDVCSVKSVVDNASTK